jgi:hypothetical protein
MYSGAIFVTSCTCKLSHHANLKRPTSTSFDSDRRKLVQTSWQSGHRQGCNPILDWVEAKPTSGCTMKARALIEGQSLFGVSMWIPGEGTQHFTSAKLVGMPLHPYIAAWSPSAKRQNQLGPRMVRCSKQDRFEEDLMYAC